MKDVKKVLSKAMPHITKFLNTLDKDINIKIELNIQQRGANNGKQNNPKRTN